MAEKWKISEGWRRLSLVLGFIGLSLWAIGFAYITITDWDALFGEPPSLTSNTHYQNRILQAEWKRDQRDTQIFAGIFLIITGIVSFGLPWAGVRVVAWTVDGFKKRE
jgi:hypothetical protein